MLNEKGWKSNYSEVKGQNSKVEVAAEGQRLRFKVRRLLVKDQRSKVKWKKSDVKVQRSKDTV